MRPKLNQEILKPCTFAAVTASMEMAKEEDRIQVLQDLLFHKGISVQFMGINRC
jgi:hypothetical protein